MSIPQSNQLLRVNIRPDQVDDLKRVARFHKQSLAGFLGKLLEKVIEKHESKLREV